LSRLPCSSKRKWKCVKASFNAPMLLERTARLPEGALWWYELKWDGYCTITERAFV
jgi:ATP-dependent DNA ligase